LLFSVKQVNFLRIFFIILFSVVAIKCYAQQTVFGNTFNESNDALKGVFITNLANSKTTYSDSNGLYKIEYTQGQKNILKVEYKGYKTLTQNIPKLFYDESFQLNIQLFSDTFEFVSANVKGRRHNDFGIIINLNPLDSRPSVSGDFNDYIKTLPGVSSNNELSSQYNVRGGSYDENLIYVNDIEVYRPQMVRSGQQEGLSFVNPDMVQNLSFSAGGFEAKYGDKLSSVLDVKYRKPTKNRAGFQIGLLGSSVFVEGVTKAKERVGSYDSVRSSFIIGVRYRANRNVLNSLDAIGIYKSQFTDVQALYNYFINRYARIEVLGNFAKNRYSFEPEYQETSFGTLERALRLRIGMDGQEIVDYTSGMGAISFVHNKNFNEFKIIATAYSSNEKEHLDIEGAYQIYDVNNSIGSSGFGDVRNLLGSGYFINHARNDLYFNVFTLAVQNEKKMITFGNNSKLTVGAKYQREMIEDRFKEWRYSDSSGYNINPFGTVGQDIQLLDYINSKTFITNNRLSGFAQFQQGFGEFNQGSFIVGTRVLNSSLNNQTLVSPRVQFYYEPNKRANYIISKNSKDSIPQYKTNILLKAAFGYYYQAPFYREMRNFDGKVNTNLNAQRSIHSVAGMEFTFKQKNRPFKFFAEAYYKQLDYLVPYVLDNVRIRYYAQNSARGYATGIDTRINGEFIKGLESWITLSFLKTDERIKYLNNDSVEVESGLLRRPTDRRVSASIVFQDELKTNPDYRVHLMLIFGSGMPYYLGGSARYKEGNVIPSYKRVDIGFSKILIGGKRTKIKSKVFKKLWVGADVFNLLQINNVISYLWIKDFQNNTYGVPNYLTGRLLNVRLIGEF